MSLSAAAVGLGSHSVPRSAVVRAGGPGPSVRTLSRPSRGLRAAAFSMRWAGFAPLPLRARLWRRPLRPVRLRLRPGLRLRAPPASAPPFRTLSAARRVVPLRACLRLLLRCGFSVAGALPGRPVLAGRPSRSRPSSSVHASPRPPASSLLPPPRCVMGPPRHGWGCSALSAPARRDWLVSSPSSLRPPLLPPRALLPLIPFAPLPSRFGGRFLSLAPLGLVWAGSKRLPLPSVLPLWPGSRPVGRGPPFVLPPCLALAVPLCLFASPRRTRVILFACRSAVPRAPFSCCSRAAACRPRLRPHRLGPPLPIALPVPAPLSPAAAPRLRPFAPAPCLPLSCVTPCCVAGAPGLRAAPSSLHCGPSDPASPSRPRRRRSLLEFASARATPPPDPLSFEPSFPWFASAPTPLWAFSVWSPSPLSLRPDGSSRLHLHVLRTARRAWSRVVGVFALPLCRPATAARFPLPAPFSPYVPPVARYCSLAPAPFLLRHSPHSPCSLVERRLISVFPPFFLTSPRSLLFLLAARSLSDLLTAPCLPSFYLLLAAAAAPVRFFFPSIILNVQIKSSLS